MSKKLREINFLTLFISLRCSHQCGHCLYACNPINGEDMSLDVFEKSINIAKKNKITKLAFFGGEPFINSEIIRMIDYVLKKGFELIIATNSYFLNNDSILKTFYDITRDYKGSISFTIGNDKYHRQYFDPSNVADKLIINGYSVCLQDVCDDAFIITEHNKNKTDGYQIDDKNVSCCGHGKENQIGILPNGGWTICPPSLTEFGNIYNTDLKELLGFKQNLSLKCGQGCTVCLKDFDQYYKEFNLNKKREVSKHFFEFF